MNKRICFRSALAALWLLGSLVACKQDTVSPAPGNVVTTNRPVSGFTGLEISDGIQTTVVKGSTEGVTIEANEGYQSYILTEVASGVLRIRLSSQLDRPAGTTIKAVVTLNTLSSIKASGGVRLSSAGPFQTSALAIDVSGGGQLTLPINTDALTVRGSGGATLELTGTAKTLTIPELSGGGTLSAANLSAATCTLNASGGSVVEVNVSQELNVTASGGSRIRYRGTPKITQNLTGGSTLSQI